MVQVRPMRKPVHHRFVQVLMRVPTRYDALMHVFMMSVVVTVAVLVVQCLVLVFVGVLLPK